MIPSDYEKEFGGDLNVYARIFSLTDCPTLRKEFDQAEEESKRQEFGSPRKKLSVGYMIAAADRMDEIRCSGA